MVHNARMSTTVPPPPKRIRLTISVTPEVHETFTRLAKASGTSISFQMGEWLADTLDAAQHVTGLVERARQAPAVLARELHAYSLGLADEMGAVVKGMASGAPKMAAIGGAATRAPLGARGDGSSDPIPPSSNTGGKPPHQPQRKQARK